MLSGCYSVRSSSSGSSCEDAGCTYRYECTGFTCAAAAARSGACCCPCEPGGTAPGDQAALDTLQLFLLLLLLLLLLLQVRLLLAP
jgi:hypothetical protein